jgi:hypothetical protein
MSCVAMASLLLLLGALTLLGTAEAPLGILGPLLSALSAAAGLLLLAWLWSWRRPILRKRVMHLAGAVRAAAESRVPVRTVYWLGSASGLERLWVRVVVASDADRAVLCGADFQQEWNRLVAAAQLPIQGHAGIRLTVDSQETVDREFAGDWHAYDQ